MLGRREIDPAGGEQRRAGAPSTHSGDRSRRRPNVESSVKPKRRVRSSSTPRSMSATATRPRSLPRARDRREGLAHDLGRAVSFGGVRLGASSPAPVERRADVAVAAAAEQLLLVAEVAEDEVVPAGPRVDVAEELAEERPRARGRSGVASAAVRARRDEAAAERDVRARAEEQTPGLGAVAPGAADLLVVRLDRRRRLHVHDGADVGPIDPHPERVGRDDDVERCGPRSATRRACAPPRPSPRGTRRRSSRFARNVSAHCSVCAASPRRRWRRRAARSPRPARPRGPRRPRRGPRRRRRRGAPRGAGWAARSRAGPRGSVAETQLLANLATDLGRRRGRAREDARRPQARQELADAQVVGPEVVAPLRDAVGLVDRDERHVAPGERLDERARGEALGRGVDELVRAAQHRRPRAPARSPGRASRRGTSPRRRAPRARAPGPPSARRAARARASSRRARRREPGR